MVLDGNDSFLAYIPPAAVFIAPPKGLLNLDLGGFVEDFANTAEYPL